MDNKLTPRVFLFVTILAGASLSIAGCGSNGSGQAGNSGNNVGEAGSVGLDLQVGGATVTTASYTITGHSGFSRTGSINVGQSNTVSVTIADLPAGTGFSISLSATSTDGTLSCAGSATFAVTAHSTTAVSVPLACHQAPRAGSVLVNGNINVCPVLDGLGASPAEVWNPAALAGSKIVQVLVDGMPINPAATYTVSTNNFLATGGDGFTKFTLGTDQVGGPIDLDVLIDYVEAHTPISPALDMRIKQGM